MSQSLNAKQRTVEGTVSRLHLSGLGRNSGELTLTLATPSDNDGVTQVFAANMNSDLSDYCVEPAVFAGYVSIATAAMANARTLRCTYFEVDKWRIQALSLL